MFRVEDLGFSVQGQDLAGKADANQVQRVCGAHGRHACTGSRRQALPACHLLTPTSHLTHKTIAASRKTITAVSRAREKERERERAQTRYLARVCGVQALLGIVVRHVLDGRIGKHLFRIHFLVCAHQGGLMRRAREAPGIQAADTTGTPVQNKSATTILCCLWWFCSYPDAHGHVAFPEGERPLLRDDARQ